MERARASCAAEQERACCLPTKEKLRVQVLLSLSSHYVSKFPLAKDSHKVMARCEGQRSNCYFLIRDPTGHIAKDICEGI